MRILALYIFLVLSLLVKSQEVKNEPVKIQKNGRDYYLHIVEAGNTLYAISRQYSIHVDLIRASNSGNLQELTIGDTILIPVNEFKGKQTADIIELDRNFLIHNVDHQQTLYSIAKEYNVDINQIVAANPGLEEGLKKGMKIKIPIAKIKAERNDSIYTIPRTVSPYITHEVLPKETLYSISKEFNVSIDSLRLVNQGLEEGLKVGQLINIPKEKTYKPSSEALPVFDSTALKEAYKVALLLPFYLNEFDASGDSINKNLSQFYKNYFDKARYGLEFYQGFKIALDSLVSLGLNLNLFIYDTKQDTGVVDSILGIEKLKEMDLIVGPLYLDEFIRVADFAKKNGIHIVSPVKQSNRILLGNNFVSKVATSEPIRIKFLGNLLAQKHRNDNILVVYQNNFDEQKRKETILRNFNLSIEKSNDSSRVSFPREIIWSSDQFYSVKSRLEKDKQNIIVVPSEDQAFITQFLTFLSPLVGDFDILVYGLNAWQNYDNLEIDYLHSLKVQIVSSEFIDHQSKDVIDFENKFKNTYGVSPEKFSYLGFDVSYFYLNLLLRFGANFEIMLLGDQEELLGRKFEFVKTGIESGYENHGLYLLKYEDFSLKLVD